MTSDEVESWARQQPCPGCKVLFRGASWTYFEDPDGTLVFNFGLPAKVRFEITCERCCGSWRVLTGPRNRLVLKRIASKVSMEVIIKTPNQPTRFCSECYSTCVFEEELIMLDASGEVSVVYSNWDPCPECDEPVCHQCRESISICTYCQTRVSVLA